ncbi:PREDICTED: SWI/SNF-related matrix-associated actin-dependent regulator of chromatin subfamily E member 1-like isoform X2 [Amphimedon queenslandica]|uniref:HMG box domain-containing protein n=1 Tax=Amphimedon queenslandica TaxID=400682 RepID=A0AAN0J098_AMPQE|nr:PREDICTED: SWI/SNF-related matrix-associated actin-dependent regulator of chromatin subfamily E member 1-like isoform X2 [Amphimedon queenslandica]|eukprot:XP_019850136.1 PREDICTED: SWI/SNF-related matrix-associated actin-dependent regulator of chromatin subfamily E member 1-like isoform X2 [Amphimedon queenslandica]
MAGMQPPPHFPYYPAAGPSIGVGQYRSHYPTSAPPMQSMTSHWNLPPPAAQQSHMPHHHSSMGGGGGNKNKAMPGGPMGALKPPKAPEKPLLPYMRYSRKMWEHFKKSEGTDLKVWEVGKIIGQKWRELSDEDKQPYFDEYEAEKVVYDENMKAYKCSFAYKQYLEAKKIAERHANSNSPGPHGYMPDLAPPPPQVIAPPRHPSGSDPRLVMLQQQEEDDDEYITTKQLASSRYHRNHRLMREIFSDSVLPDIKSSVTMSRIDSLKHQSASLSAHQKKLEDEVNQLEARYSEKRNQFLDDAEKFRKELKRIQDNPPSSWKKTPVQLSSKDIPEPIPSANYHKM